MQDGQRLGWMRSKLGCWRLSPNWFCCNQSWSGSHGRPDHQVPRRFTPGCGAYNCRSFGLQKDPFFESQTSMRHSFKATARGEEALPKKLSAPEGQAGLERQRQELRGGDIQGPLEPSHALYDLCASMIEKNEVAYISPSKCPSRQQEFVGTKPEKEIQWIQRRQLWSSKSRTAQPRSISRLTYRYTKLSSGEL